MNGTKCGTEAAGPASAELAARNAERIVPHSEFRVPRCRGGRRASCIRVKGDGQRPLDEARVIMPERVTIKRVRIPFAESLRFPGEGKSAQG